MDKLTKMVQTVILALPETTVFLSALRKIKNDQIEVEFVQSRTLAGRRASIIGALNQGDDRFSSGRTTMRVWTKVTEEGFNASFPGIKDQEGNDFNFAEAAKLALTAGGDERIAIFLPVTSVMLNGVLKDFQITAMETVEVEELPKSIRDQITNPDVDDAIKNRYILQTGERNGKASEHIVDKHGQTVYRWYQLDTTDRTDTLIADKYLVSDLAKKATNTAAPKTASSVLASALAEE